MKLAWRTTAERDLERTVEFYVPLNPTAAAKIEHRLRTAVEHLREFPRAGRIGRKVGTREVVITEYPYLIRYRIAGEQVQILRIFHTSTQWIDR